MQKLEDHHIQLLGAEERIRYLLSFERSRKLEQDAIFHEDARMKSRVGVKTTKLKFEQIIKAKGLLKIEEIFAYSKEMEIRLTIKDWHSVLFTVGYYPPPQNVITHTFIQQLKQQEKRLFPRARLLACNCPKKFTKLILLDLLESLNLLDSILVFCPSEPSKMTREYLIDLTNSVFFARADAGHHGIPLLDRIFIEVRAIGADPEDNFQDIIEQAMTRIQDNAEDLLTILPW